MTKHNPKDPIMDPLEPMGLSHHGVIVFDGVCNFCNFSVNFIIARDHNDTFRFTPMQSTIGSQLLAMYNIPSENIDTFLLIIHGKALIKSDAVVSIAKELRPPWNYLVAIKFIPKPIRDFFYSFIARNRYRWFGKKEHCMTPTVELKRKFIL